MRNLSLVSVLPVADYLHLAIGVEKQCADAASKCAKEYGRCINEGK